MTRQKSSIAGVLAIFGFSMILTSCDDKATDEPNDTGTGVGNTDTGPKLVPIADPASTLVGKVFIFDIDDLDWSIPRGAGPEFGRYVPPLIFEITAYDAATNTLTFFAGTAKDGAQDLCAVTTTLTASFANNPSFKTTAVDFSSAAENPSSVIKRVPATLYNMSFGGNFSEDGTTIAKGTFDGTIDFREVYELFHLVQDPTPEKLCVDVTDYGANCTACPDGQPRCLVLGAELIEASLAADGVIVEERTAYCK